MLSKVIILAGGKGERLWPLTADRPKGMVEILGKPLLEYQLRWLRSQGIKDVTMACGYLSDVIQDYFGDGQEWELKISYSVEKSALGRGGAVKQALSGLQPLMAPVLVMNGDNICDLNLKELFAFHNQTGAVATIVCVPLKCPYGIVDLNGNSLIAGFQEKPELPHWVNAGIYVFNPEVYDLLPVVGDHEIITFPELARNGRLHAYKTRTFWKGIDTAKDLSELNAQLEQLYFQPILNQSRA
jgi:NDP-sugar pyrophosphorylase family protein